MSEPYKGVRDFYPEDERIQNHIFGAMRRVVESFGYEEMNASILEATELYTAKTSEEIVREQTYTFTDRGERSVTLRPEMTPTVARMVAAKKRDLGFPLRWYSIQNFFRYERPQRGRTREFWQLNADLFGAEGMGADSEIVTLAYRVMRALGAEEKDFVIRVSDRRFLDALYETLGVEEKNRQAATRLLDKKDKENIETPLKELLGSSERATALLEGLVNPGIYPPLLQFKEMLSKRGIGNVVIDTAVARGFDYYTGMVFEVFDTNPENARSLFGGGRYDNLIEQYGGGATPAVGFAMGDVVTRDFLETHGLLLALPPSAQLYLAPVQEKNNENASKLADELRTKGVNVALGMGDEKMGDHIKAALKLGIPYFAAYGDEEESSGMILVKTLSANTEEKMTVGAVSEYIASVQKNP